MTSQMLEKCRAYEAKAEKEIKDGERPSFHLSVRTGWMNDPNGFSCYNGQYHMFYQYYPYATQWGPMHWGHAVSRDLLHWAYLPAALAPDQDIDNGGCFSGSAATLPDGRQLLMYTGVRTVKNEDGTEEVTQTQCLAIGDGKEYGKIPNNPVLDERSVPEGGSRVDFRDPKIWREQDGTYRCIVGNRAADGSGQILLYTSEDGLVWKYKSVLDTNRNRFGKMWECPDFFKLGGRWVLLTSPQDMEAVENRYHSGNGTLCLVGDYEEESGTFREASDQTVDFGIDFYAPQTILTPDGRRVMIGWMQNWDTCSICPPDQKWFGQMSLPRELFLKDGRLCQRPVRELEALRTNRVDYTNVPVDGELELPGVKGRRADMEMTLRPKENCHTFTICFAQDAKHHCSLTFRPKEQLLTISRELSGTRRALWNQTSCRVNSEDGELKLRMILDRFSAEVFVGDGEQVMTMTFYPDQSADGISFHSDGGVSMDLVKYDLTK